jgi:hypothetical protein
MSPRQLFDTQVQCLLTACKNHYTALLRQDFLSTFLPLSRHFVQRFFLFKLSPPKNDQHKSQKFPHNSCTKKLFFLRIVKFSSSLGFIPFYVNVIFPSMLNVKWFHDLAYHWAIPPGCRRHLNVNNTLYVHNSLNKQQLLVNGIAKNKCRTTNNNITIN